MKSMLTLPHSLARRLLPADIRHARPLLPGIALLAFLLAPAAAIAAKNETQVQQTGELPRTGRVVIRSGMAWLDETSVVYQRVSAALAKELTARGLTVIPVKASALEPMPKTPLPNR